MNCGRTKKKNTHIHTHTHKRHIVEVNHPALINQYMISFSLFLYHRLEIFVRIQTLTATMPLIVNPKEMNDGPDLLFSQFAVVCNSCNSQSSNYTPERPPAAGTIILSFSRRKSLYGPRARLFRHVLDAHRHDRHPPPLMRHVSSAHSPDSRVGRDLVYVSLFQLEALAFLLCHKVV